MFQNNFAPTCDIETWDPFRINQFQIEWVTGCFGMSYGELRSNLGVQKAWKIALLYRQLNSV